MAGGSELEPGDSRNVTGTAHTPDGRWSGDAPAPGHGGELEPADSRNVTGTASTPDGRWTNDAIVDGPGASSAPRPGSPAEDDQGIPQTGEEDPLAEVSAGPDDSRSAADVSRVQFANNGRAAIQIFMRPGDVELVQSLAAGETSEWITVPSGAVTFVAYAPGTGPGGQELGSWIGTVQPMRDVTVSFTASNTAEATDPVFSPTMNEMNAAG